MASTLIMMILLNHPLHSQNCPGSKCAYLFLLFNYIIHFINSSIRVFKRLAFIWVDLCFYPIQHKSLKDFLLLFTFLYCHISFCFFHNIYFFNLFLFVSLSLLFSFVFWFACTPLLTFLCLKDHFLLGLILYICCFITDCKESR